MREETVGRAGPIARPFRRWLGELARRSEPLDYDPGAVTPRNTTSRASQAEVGSVDVIVPVHGAADAVERCFSSVAAHTDLTRHRLVVVVDGDPASRRESLLEPHLADSPRTNVLWLENPECVGFAASVNRGMEQSDRDVILLNSDTRVTQGWVEKLQSAAYSASEIATVTPFSNHATICSLPQPLELNALPTDYDVDSFARLVERVAEPSYPRLPTGVGMCLYIKRQALDELGLFDAERFGPGYGEETDFCFRALAAGFLHVLDDATFIFHEGERSFGGERARRIRGAERALRRLHPAYWATLAAFLKRDPLRSARERVTRALQDRAASGASVQVSEVGPRRIVHLVHGWPPFSHGGTEYYAHWLASCQQAARPVSVYARLADPERSLGAVTELFDRGVRVRLVVNNFEQRNPLARNALREPRLEADFGRFLDRERPDLVHVHHLAGHGFSLLHTAAARGLPIVYQVQDWWALCARANRMQPGVGLCPGPEAARCAACLPLTGLPPAPLLNRGLYSYRRRLARNTLKLADAFVMGSRTIARDYRAAGLLPNDGQDVHILPYGVELPEERQAASERAPALPLRCGFVGALMPHKGVHVAVRAFEGLNPERATLEIWGDPAAAPDYVAELHRLADSRSVRFGGTFDTSEKQRVFRGMDLLLVPSLGLESFGLVAREAMAHGVPVVASRRGALSELFEGDPPVGGGTTFEPGDVAGLRTLLEKLIARPEIIGQWRREIPPILGLQDHAESIERLYAKTLERHRSGGAQLAGTVH